MNSFFQWIIRIFLSIFVSFFLTVAIVILTKNDSQNFPALVFFLSIFPVILISHLISKMPVLTQVSLFKKYIIISFGLITFLIVGSFSCSFYLSYMDRATNCSTGCEKNKYKDECYYQCASKNSDILFCDKIISVDYKNNCYDRVSVQSEQFYCDKINGGYEYETIMEQGHCYLFFAVKNKDISICDKIPLTGYYALPRYRCYWQVAVAIQDPSLCLKIPDVFPIPGYEKDTALINNLKKFKSDCLVLKK